jgi:hypothetical protein
LQPNPTDGDATAPFMISVSKDLALATCQKFDEDGTPLVH